MQIAETASHRPFQYHELSVSRHIPEREYYWSRGPRTYPPGPRPEIAREGRGELGSTHPSSGSGRRK